MTQVYMIAIGRWEELLVYFKELDIELQGELIRRINSDLKTIRK